MQRSISILALGDSYTIGEGVQESDRWLLQLTHLLKTKDISISHLQTIAKTGWTTGELLNAIKEQNIQSTDLVFLLIGVNNQYRGYPLNEYEEEFHKLLGLAINYAQNYSESVYVLSIPDWGNTPYAEGKDREKITKEIDAFNQINKEEALRQKANYIDITDITRIKSPKNNLLTTDGLHPSAEMYKLWAERIFEYLNTNQYFKQEN